MRALSFFLSLLSLSLFCSLYRSPALSVFLSPFSHDQVGFADNETVATIIVLVRDDSLPEADETLSVRLTGAATGLSVCLSVCTSVCPDCFSCVRGRVSALLLVDVSACSCFLFLNRTLSFSLSLNIYTL